MAAQKQPMGGARRGPEGPAQGGRRKSKARTAIVRAAQELFAAKPIESVTIDEILAAADVSKGSFYNHFTDKEDLARTLYELIRGDTEFHIFSTNRDVTDPPARVARALCVVIRYALEHPSRVRFALVSDSSSTDPNSPMNVGVAADVAQGIKDGRFRGVDHETAVIIVGSMMHGALSRCAGGGSKTRPSGLAAALGGAFLTALGVEPDEARRIAADAASEILSGKDWR